MFSIGDLKKLSFLVYGLGLSGKSVVNFFRKNKFKNYQVWDDNYKNLFKNKRPKNLHEALKKTDYIILSPGISIEKILHKRKLRKFKNKIITDIDLIFLTKKYFKSIVVTGTNGKSTTCKIISHLLKKNGFKTLLGGNIGVPVLNLKAKKDYYIINQTLNFDIYF